MSNPSDHEEQRYAAIQAQIKEQFDAAVNDRSPIIAMMRALLCAELYTKNEQAHQRAMQTQQDQEQSQH